MDLHDIIRELFYALAMMGFTLFVTFAVWFYFIYLITNPVSAVICAFPLWWLIKLWLDTIQDI